MNNAYEEKLGTEGMLSLVFRMALPSIAAQIVNLLYSIVDRIYIGHISGVGTDALAGIGITSSIIILISAFSSIVSGGGAPLAAIALGKGDRERAEKILGNGFVMLVVFAIITSSLAYIFMKPLLRINGASNATIGYAVDYLLIYLFGTVFVQISVGLNTFINSQGRPGIAMCSVMIGALLNIALDPIFIFTLGMGVKGAAWATVISQACSAVWVLAFLSSDKATLRLSSMFMKPDTQIIGSILSLGVSPFVMASTESLVGLVLNSGLSRFGDIYVSALTVMQSAMQIIGVPISGFAQGVIPILSYNFGHGNRKRVREGFKISLMFMFGVNFIITLSMILFPSTVAAVFTDDVKLIALVSDVMPVFLAGMLIFGLQRTCQNTFVALGQAKISLFIALLRKVILLVPLALILPHFMGVMGIYTAEALADGTAAITCTIIFAIRFPKILAEAGKEK